MKGMVIVEKENVFEKVFKDIPFTKDYCEKELKELEVKSKEQDIVMRKEYAGLIFKFVCYYMAFVFIILFLSGTPSSFKMSDSVLITLLGTTTATVISLFAIVVNYLFPKK